MASNPISIVNAIVTNLSAASVLGSGRAAKDYSVIETTQEPTAVIGFRSMAGQRDTFGGLDSAAWVYRAEVFFKDKGSSSALMDAIVTTSGKVYDSLRSDDTLQGTVEQIFAIRAERTPGEAFQTGTVTLYKVDFEIDVLEWPDG